MSSTIQRPCYVTREELKRSLDVKQSLYNDQQIDRQIIAGSDSIDQLCKRVFFPTDATYKFDWPNYQYTYPWKLYFRDHGGGDLAAQPTLVVTGTYLTVPIVIPIASCIFQPVNSGPPFTWMELRRDLSAFFGGNTTPQNDIGVTGSWGYWLNTQPGGLLTSGIDGVTTTLQMSAGAGVYVGVGDTIIIDNERMLVTDIGYNSTGITFNGLVSTPPSASDNVLTVADGTQFSAQETISLDSEIVRVINIIGNNLILKRAWDGTVLATHTSGTIYANRQATVVRGALGTTAAAHLANAPIKVLAIPGLVKQTALAEAVIGLTQEPNAYAFDLETRTRVAQNVYGGTGHAQQREPAIGVGITDLRDRCAARYGVQVRSRVI